MLSAPAFCVATPQQRATNSACATMILAVVPAALHSCGQLD